MLLFLLTCKLLLAAMGLEKLVYRPTHQNITLLEFTASFSPKTTINYQLYDKRCIQLMCFSTPFLER
uniref:Secreted protein n=1 Tax=Anguilla anguilla TaxID=7936 RepID=A0A0E9WEI3_ANGAN